MKNVKSFLAKNFLILAFAIGGIFAVTSNVTVSGNNPPNTMGRYCTYGMQFTGNWNDVAVMCSNCYPLFGYRSHGDSGQC